MLDGANVLITGGTGSFGQAFVDLVTQRYKPRKLIVFSRDEEKQYHMQQRFNEPQHKLIRYFLGDVRDKDRLYRALDGIDVVVHAAALKQILSAEYNPLEAIKTNVLGAANLTEAAIDRNVKKVIALSTDKAASPINLYGATKLCSDKLFVGANVYSGAHNTRFSVVRYGNVIGSRGSIVPLFLSMRGNGPLPITDPRMTRFCITLEQGVNFVLDSLERMQGGEIFVPKLPSARIPDIAEAVAPGQETRTVGIRAGEKLHEVMIPEDEAISALEFEHYYVIQPPAELGVHWNYSSDNYKEPFTPCTDRFCYSSDQNDSWFSVEELTTLVEAHEQAAHSLRPSGR